MNEQQLDVLEETPRVPLTSVSFHNAGHCRQSEYFTGTGKLQTRTFYAVVVRIEHPDHGVALIDTGYSPHYFRAIAGFPERILGLLVPVARMPRQTPQQRWLDRGIDPGEVEHVFISHFHADHIGATTDFPDQNFVFRDETFRTLIAMKRFEQVHNGFFQKLLPDSFMEHATAIAENHFHEVAFSTSSDAIEFPFRCFDYWGDGSLIVVDLPGHALGQTGYLMRTADKSILYVVDACWDVKMMMRDAQLPWLSTKVQHHANEYFQTQSKLRNLAAQLDWEIVACHCPLTQLRDDHFENS